MGSLGSLFEGKEQSRGGRAGWAVDCGIRKGLEKEPLQNLESDVVRELLSAASADGEDPKANGGERTLGIPTVSDRIVQMVVKKRLEAVVDSLFLPASFGYRPNKSALDAVGQARQMCWAFDWVCDLDIKGFFDNLDHDLMMKAVRKHAHERWMVLYIERWLKAPAQDEEGNLLEREKGTPQGGVISPLLANLFLHYAFDLWMRRNWAHLPFERYADDIIVHCRTEREANLVRVKIAARLKQCGLELHP